MYIHLFVAMDSRNTARQNECYLKLLALRHDCWVSHIMIAVPQFRAVDR